MAGQMFNTANAPIQGYADAMTRSMLSPYESALQSALQGRTALQTAIQNRDIQYRTDPQAYQAREMALGGANNTVGRLYGVSPSQYSFQAPNAYNLPSTSMLPSLSSMGALSRAITSNMSGVNISPESVSLTMPQNPQNLQLPPQNPYMMRYY